MFVETYLAETASIARAIDPLEIEHVTDALIKVRRRGGRVFVLGLGGSQANAEHCVNDLRVRAGLQAYAPPVPEWTARGNDQGWAVALREWLRGSKLVRGDGVILLSGSGESFPLMVALRYAVRTGATTIGIVGAVPSAMAKECEHVVAIPCPHERRAGHAESFQSVVWHCLAAHPKLAV